MKKIKTIAIFCIAVVLFSFQTTDTKGSDPIDVVDPELELYSQVTVLYGDDVNESAKIALRNYYAQEWGKVFQVRQCRNNPQLEMWIFDNPMPRPRDGSGTVVINTEHWLYWRGGPLCQ